jgi:BirA family biotin operon repressor/biotin-[acetyl-CoA-carboxylase] ligase
MSAFPHNYTFTHLPETNSTNLYAMEQLYAGLAAAGNVFFADYQLAGKGQRGKTWQAFPGESILVSVVFDTSKLAPSQSFRLSAAMALGCKNFLQSLTGEDFEIKWPNDLYWHDRKAGGILIENVMNMGSWKWSVVGIGINLNQLQFPPELPGAVSLKMITEKSFVAAEQAKVMCGFLDAMWQSLNQGEWPQILQDYNKALYGRGQVKKLKRGPAVIPCMIRRVNDHGLLLAGENEEWRFEHGEVEWLATTENRES